MRLFTAIALSLLIAAANARAPDDQPRLFAADGSAEDLVREATVVVQKSEKIGKEHAHRIAEMCQVEVEATDAWLKDGAQLEHRDSNTDKTALASALDRRAAAVSKIISQLRGVRAQLQGHANRVNEVFSTMHSAMQTEVSHNARSLDHLGVAFGSWGVFKSPSARPIELGKTRAQDFGEATALLEVAVSAAKEDAVTDAHVGTLDAVFENFKRAISLWEPINEDFEHERAVLDALDKEVERVLISKQAKLRHLTEQAAELRSSGAAAKKTPALSEAMQVIRQHRTIISAACAEAKRHAKSASQLKQQIISFMHGSTKGAPKSATGAANAARDDGVALPPIEIPGPAAAAAASADEADDVVSKSGRRLQFKQANHAAADAKDLLSQVLNQPMAAAGKALR